MSKEDTSLIASELNNRINVARITSFER
ncbi:hypothetical protein PI23P_12647 [Polaribacter irgensii 23-P]|uniref:Uncharacterized protein n=1 Tax=Polaribacter irgensii 23-P TaxID=313594 RepID=A4C232_9FLAO|nr:hypothetical protein PI23P_12647 [Polaribacter irgensii 23-P]